MGRRPKPTKLKLIEGNPGKRAINKREPQPKSSKTSAPGHLAKHAKSEWRRLAPELHRLGLLTMVDRAALAAYCQAYARWRDAEEKLAEEGAVIVTTNGNFVQNPLVGAANKAMELMHKFLIEFGMTPASRAKLSVPAGPVEKESGLISG